MSGKTKISFSLDDSDLAYFRAIFRASFRLPELNAGWPQQVCDSGTRTSAPNRSRTATVAKATRGKKASARQVKKRETGMDGCCGIHQVYRRSAMKMKPFRAKPS